VTDANDFLFGKKTKGAKFAHIGDSITGVVAKEPELKVQTDIDTGAVLKWENGEERQQVVVTLKTSERDPSDEDDDGTRVVYVKGKSLTDAVKLAVKSAGEKGIHTGGTLTVTYVGDGVGRKFPPKLYTASYTAPPVSFDGVAGPAAQQPAPATQPAVATSVLGTPAAAVPPAPAGVDAATWAAMAPEQRQRVLAALAPTAGVTPPF
jgi:hypothetical protein